MKSNDRDEQSQPTPTPRQDLPRGMSQDSVTIFRLLPAARQREIKVSYKAWRNALIKIINHKSEIEIRSNGEFQFVLPPDLVNIVWEVTIRQQTEMAAKKGSKSPYIDALKNLSAELSEHADNRLRLQTQCDSVDAADV